MPSEYIVPFQLVAMDNRSVDMELAAQLLAPRESDRLLQNAEKDAQSVDDAVAAQLIMHQGSITLKATHKHQQSERSSTSPS
jgi:hypothetical protein